MSRAFGQRVAMCCDMLSVVGSSLAQVWSNLSQQHPKCRSTSQHAGQTHATCWAQQCCDMLWWYVAIVWPISIAYFFQNSSVPVLYCEHTPVERRASVCRVDPAMQVIIVGLLLD